MVLQLQDFARQYAGMQDEELLRLALAPQELMPEALDALNAEMSRRGLRSEEHLQAFRVQEEHREKKFELRELQRKKLLYPQGLGQARFCKADYTSDPATGYEEFRTTFFFLLFWLPLFPVGTYRVRRKKDSGSDFVAAERVPLSWHQVLQVWTVMMLALLGLVILVRFLPRAL
jgi:hypothetical protein